MKNTLFRTVLLVTCAMLAFAGNSILGRLALAESAIDPAGYTLIRLLSGAVALLIILRLNQSEWRKVSLKPNKTDLLAAFMLFGYAICFSYSYVDIATGTGALILFAVVQFSMIGFYLLSGNKMFFREWAGLALSIAGFVFLMGPSAVRPFGRICLQRH
ncbi:EamA family transporter [Vibrio sp. SCSIO 43137]|uniref:EamA family transporter n=1 Tax=Vibrio sp. SCSIO 43137 TaxID=3021011 RepID=UPI002307F59C|nr:EamA family transporter [Vibrio sp. SCSIO 43137]WCE28871.1 EamA family transporter [Vibrio sp. SCSIO 43137]